VLPSELVSKPIHEWGLDDLNLIVARQSEESQFLEFKEYMPLKNQGLGWNFNGILHANERDGLAKEIVAFANAYGGHLIVGIKETQEKPSRAKRLGDVNTDVAELAERLRSALNSIIDPPINGLRIQPIPLTEDGHGFLAIHVPQSIHAPHGFGKPPEAYVRRADRSEPMTMRDIQNVFWEARTRRERTDGEIAQFLGSFWTTPPAIGQLKIGLFAVSENESLCKDLRKLLSIDNPHRWTGIYRIENGAIVLEAPDNLVRNALATPSGLTAAFVHSRHTGEWQIGETGTVGAIINIKAHASAFEENPDDSWFEFHPVWVLNSIRIFADFLRLYSRTESMNGCWVFKFVAVTPNGRFFFKENNYDEPRKIDFSKGLDMRPLRLDTLDSAFDFGFFNKKLWDCFGGAADSAQNVFEGIWD
jgi:hypothetical protein